jgi:glycine/D-amino acid oxidase-like deaminating enzyme
MDADVVVIGAGALGLSTALHCALAGRSVTVMERFGAGSQASGRAAGLFKSVQADELRTRLARRSIALATTFADWAGTPLAVARPGSLLVARTAQHREFLQRELAQSRGWGADVREAPQAQLAGGLSYYRTVGEAMGIWCPEDVYIEEPTSLILAFLAVRHQLLITAPTAQVDPADPIVRVVDAAVYLRPARGGLMLGGFEPDPLPLDLEQQPASFSTDDVPLDLGVLRKLAGQVAAEVPAVDSAGVAEHRGGMFTMSPDGRFVAGPAPEPAGLWVASGCNGSGVLLLARDRRGPGRLDHRRHSPAGHDRARAGTVRRAWRRRAGHPRALAVRPLLRPGCRCA